jgi:hypothetical protein
MKSDELNRRIGEICDYPERCGGFEAFGGKSIPYIGWYWRTVDFDTDKNLWGFGLLPAGEVGFMESNKWGYQSFSADEELWKRIKELLIEAVLDPTKKKLGAVYAAVQEVGSGAR